MALPTAALCSPSLRPITTEPRHLSTKEHPRQPPLSTVPAAAAHGSDGATSGGGGVWRSRSHGGCFRNQHVAPCDDDDENDDDDDKQKEEGEDGEVDDWLVTYSRTSTSYTRPAPLVATSQPVSVCATSHKPSYHAGNPLAFGAAVAAAAAAATASASASAASAAVTTNAAGNQTEEEDEDFNAWMLSAEDAAGSRGGGRNITGGARGGGSGVASVGQSQACGSRGATDGGPDGDESEWSAALMDPSRSDRRSSTGDRRRSSRLSASSRRRNAMEYSELDAIRERLLHATQLWAITVADSSTDGADSDAAAALAAAATAAIATSSGAAAAAATAATAAAVAVPANGAAVEAQQVADATAASPAAVLGPSSSVATAAAAGRLSNGAAGNGAGKPGLPDDPIGCSDVRRRSGVFTKARSAASGTPAVTATSRRSMFRSLSAAGFAGMTVSEATASAAMLVAGGAAPGKAAGASSNLTLTLPGASSSEATGASGIPDSTTPTGPTFTFGPTNSDYVPPTSAAAPSGTSSSSLSASAHGPTCSGSSSPHVAESPFSRISTFLMRRFVSPFPIVRSSTYPVLR
ncbi:unnamed protein product [Closterium sp. NIES-53]